MISGLDRFPTDLTVYVLNKNDFDVELQWDSELYFFPKISERTAVPIPPDVAFGLFAFETRGAGNDKGYRDFTSGRSNTQESYFDRRLIAMGWAGNKDLRAAFENFEFRLHRGKQLAVDSFQKLPASHDEQPQHKEEKPHHEEKPHKK
jgi:hypothetical protein